MGNLHTTDFTEFLRLTQSFLIRDPVFNMHQARIATRTASQQRAGDSRTDARWAVVVWDDAGVVVATAVYTARKALFVTPHAPDVTSLLIAAMPRDCVVEDIVAHRDAAWQIAHALGTYEPFLEGTLYALETPPMIDSIANTRTATMDDLALLTRWSIDFIRECKLKDPINEVERRTADRIARGELFIAFDNERTPLAFAGASYVSALNGSIGPVYTHPNARGKKLGQRATTAGVAALQARGVQCVVLMADLHNPISNAAYQRIGFTPRGPFVHIQRAGGLQRS